MVKNNFQYYAIITLLVIIFVYFIYKYMNNHLEKFYIDSSKDIIDKNIIDKYIFNYQESIFSNISKDKTNAISYIDEKRQFFDKNLTPCIMKKYIDGQFKIITNAIKSSDHKKYTYDKFVIDIHKLNTAKYLFFILISKYIIMNDTNNLINIDIENEILNAINSKMSYSNISYNLKESSSNIAPPKNLEKSIYDDINPNPKFIGDIFEFMNCMFLKKACNNSNTLAINFSNIDITLLLNALKYTNDNLNSDIPDYNKFCDKYKDLLTYVYPDNKDTSKPSFCKNIIIVFLLPRILINIGFRLLFDNFSSNDKSNMLSSFNKLNNPNPNNKLGPKHEFINIANRYNYTNLAKTTNLC